MKSFLLLLILVLPVYPVLGQVSVADYDQLIINASSLFKEGKLDEASQVAYKAIQTGPSNYIAYAVAAKIASKQGNTAQATTLVNKALELAPDDIKEKIRQLAAILESSMSESSNAKALALDKQDLRTLDVLNLILSDIAKESPESKSGALREFLDRSADFAAKHPMQNLDTDNGGKINIWVMRASAAVGLDSAKEGWEAGRKLEELGLDNRDDTAVRRLFAEMDRRGWLEEQPPEQMPDNFPVELQDLFRQAARGNANAQYDLAQKLENGIGVPRDFDQADKWYRRSAEKGNANAAYMLGFAYYFGNGSIAARNYKEAVEWYRKGAEGGNTPAMGMLAQCYASGRGVAENQVEASKWYLKSAELGYNISYYDLGKRYAEGIGLPKDPQQALKWLRKAADMGIIPAQEMVRKLEQPNSSSTGN